MKEIKMEQHGDNSLQIAEISGGENTFIFQAPIDEEGAIDASPIEKLTSYLHEALIKQNRHSLTLSFFEIEEIMGAETPLSSKKPNWWHKLINSRPLSDNFGCCELEAISIRHNITFTRLSNHEIVKRKRKTAIKEYAVIASIVVLCLIGVAVTNYYTHCIFWGCFTIAITLALLIAIFAIILCKTLSRLIKRRKASRSERLPPLQIGFIAFLTVAVVVLISIGFDYVRPLLFMGEYDIRSLGFNYIGYIKNGNANGQGVLKLSNGTVYTGVFENGLLNGVGRAESGDGSVYEGCFEKGVYNGLGELRFNYVENKSQNSIVNTDVGYDKYVGNFKDGLFSEDGALFYGDGTVYKGNFIEGLRHYTAIIKFDENGRYLFPSDCATYVFSYGDIYEGEFTRGQIEGVGRITKNNGVIFEGIFCNGKKNGTGTMYFPNGDKYEGEWVDGELKWDEDFTSTVKYTFSNGVVQYRKMPHIIWEFVHYKDLISSKISQILSVGSIFVDQDERSENEQKYRDAFEKYDEERRRIVYDIAQDGEIDMWFMMGLHLDCLMGYHEVRIDDNYQFEGNFINGFINGEGRLIEIDYEGNKGYTIMGHIIMDENVNFIFSGDGYIVNEEGIKSTCVWVNNNPTGRTTVTFPDGTVRTGYWSTEGAVIFD